jgi:putative methyltransferase (TIGR04325 family)
LARTIYPQKNFEWRIYENEALVKETTKKEIDSQLNYYWDFMNVMENYAPDLIILSSTLQYLDEPLERMKALIDLGSNYILVTKTPMSEETPKTVFQKSRWNANGPGNSPQVSRRYKLTSACNILASEDFIKLISINYEIFLSFDEGSFKYSRFKRSIPYKGYLLRLKH